MRTLGRQEAGNADATFIAIELAVGDSGVIVDGDVQIIFNTTEGWQSLKDSQSIRATALNRKVPYVTTVAAAQAMARAIRASKGRSLEVRSLQTYYSARV